jgi:hypothetical protein
MSKSSRSEQFRNLERELKFLRKQLLPQKFNPTGVYPHRVITRTIAYRVLAHAEFEEYIEKRVWDLALSSIRTLETTGRVNRVVACLIAFSGQKQDFPPETLAPPSGTQRPSWDIKIELSEKAKSSLNILNWIIDQNHGMKEKNLLALLLPVGIQPSQLDVTWLSTVNSFSQQRGIFAHRSISSYRATLLPNPQDELDTVRKILSGFRAVDDNLNKLLP